MSTVYSLRIPKALKQALEQLEDINWQAELRVFLERKVRLEYTRRQLKEARSLRARMKRRISSAEIIREDRKTAH